MRRLPTSLLTLTFGLLLPLVALRAQALSLGPDEFVAARHLTCVLAQDSLGYLTPDDFEVLSSEVLDSYEPEEGDVIYAKALGYFDGLMFGLPEQDAEVIHARLRSFVDSQACTQVVGVSFRL
ncbi:hypothetical protein FV139_12630 [Parahaliea maris]|uniref:Rap1a immunity protein domain-containing protein n=1 Tax=Parahaliea maris TaxID=2716870 RepID=A0A5C8ZZ61_9GAMM|nr:hypothetical protein [Parahaliea maris]TXS92810.1 hypothetical protein FV139_12630 [Parahaliea maris]